MDINKIVVKVPASVGYVGSGFDCSGLSLNVFNEFIVEKNIKNSFILSNKVSQDSEN